MRLNRQEQETMTWEENTMDIFIPLTDELLEEHPELIDGPCVPYRQSLPCWHAETIDERQPATESEALPCRH